MEKEEFDTEGKERVFRLKKDKDSLDQVLVGDIVLDVMGVVLNTECQQLHDDWQQVGGLIVICTQSHQSSTMIDGRWAVW